ncbi:MAG: His-Xaa-Ser system radical SAM maturase HxsB [Candidatus Gastranaerophilales bacterium]|nr:His-Xaa-Ser system radical SAM maturase HxsB [Candidatus Gastranaerophilales bacterium]
MSYKLLPFRFTRFDNNQVLLCNEVGEFIFITDDEFDRFIKFQLDPTETVFLNLKSKQILTDTEIEPVIEMLSTKYRTKKSFLNDFTSLHMVVATLRCNSTCRYCQVSRRDINAKEFDMNKATAKKVVDLIFNSPSPSIKIEFQGGEPLLNFEIVKYIIEYAEWVNIFKKKQIEYVICTNLSLINDKILNYLKDYKVYISTSLDGHKYVHNSNRPLQEYENSYDLVIDKINLCMTYLGQDSVSALMTTTNLSLKYYKEIVDEYVQRGFNTIFLRSLNPYGFAKRDKSHIGYNMDDFLDFYKKTLNYIIDLNLNNTYFVESYACLLLTRILTPFSTGFVDLQSPSGVGISGVIYDYDGNVYISDEARMLASTGNQNFIMGNVHQNSYQELFNSKFMHNLISLSCIECLPECAYCAYQSYCGIDPVRNYSEQGDTIGNRILSESCRKNKEIIKYLFEKIRQNDNRINSIFWSWINNSPINKQEQELSLCEA